MRVYCYRNGSWSFRDLDVKPGYGIDVHDQIFKAFDLPGRLYTNPVRRIPRSALTGPDNDPLDPSSVGIYLAFAHTKMTSKLDLELSGFVLAVVIAVRRTPVYFRYKKTWTRREVETEADQVPLLDLRRLIGKACGLESEPLIEFYPLLSVTNDKVDPGNNPPVDKKHLGPDCIVNSGEVSMSQYGNRSFVFLVGLRPWPWVLTPSWAPCSHLFVLYAAQDNHPFVYELALACSQIFRSIALGPDETVFLSPQAVNEGGTGLQLVCSKGTFANDAWLQDQFRIGYFYRFKEGKRDRTPRALNFPRSNGTLKNMVAEILGVIRVYNNVHFGGKSSGQSAGGNLLVSPPVAAPTDPIAVGDIGDGGPSVPAHPAAPLGKLVLGDTKAGQMSPLLRLLLTSQHIQPVLPIDTSWLHVGHADEILNFVGNVSTTAHHVLIGSPALWIKGLGELVAKHRELFVHVSELQHVILTNQTNIEDNLKIEEQKLTPLRTRLTRGLLLPPTSFIPLPVLYHADRGIHGGVRACTPNLVNLQLLNGHALVPRPFGPRLPNEAALACAGALLELAQLRDIKLTPSEPGFTVWAECGITATELATKYMGHVPGQDSAKIEALCAANSSSLVDGKVADGQDCKLRRIQIPDGACDPIEIYVRSVFDWLGYRVHFIDCTAYHNLGGEIHCGTNAQHDLPEDWTIERCEELWNANKDYDLSYKMS